MNKEALLSILAVVLLSMSGRILVDTVTEITAPPTTTSEFVAF